MEQNLLRAQVKPLGRSVEEAEAKGKAPRLQTKPLGASVEEAEGRGKAPREEKGGVLFEPES